MFSFLASRKHKEALRDALYRNVRTTAKDEVLNAALAPASDVKPALGLSPEMLAQFDNAIARPAAAQAAVRR